MKKNTQIQSRNPLLNDVVILLLIILNTATIWWQFSECAPEWLTIVDALLTLAFVAEAICKIRVFGWKDYWSESWNRFDFIITAIALPSLLAPFGVGIGEVSVILVLRALRVLRVFKSIRVVRFLPDIEKILAGVKRAVKSAYVVVVTFVVLLVVSALISCAFFGKYSPEFFGTPTEAIWSTFRLFTVEGWYEIPDSVMVGMGAFGQTAVRIYFIVLLFCGGILGMSLINSIMVDAMVEDNNDDVKEQLRRLEEKIDKLSK